MSEDGGPRQVRGRNGPQRFGLLRNDSSESELVFQENVLWFRTMLFFIVLQACSPCPPYMAWEHPEDPASWSPVTSSLQDCPSVWAFPEMHRMQTAVKAWLALFKELWDTRRGRPQVFSPPSWLVYESLHQVRGQGQEPRVLAPARPSQLLPGSTFESSAWACWSSGLVSVLKQGWRRHVQQPACVRVCQDRRRQEALCSMSPEWAAHVSADHDVPYRRDCEVCLQAASGHQWSFCARDGHRRKEEVLCAIKVLVGSDFPWREGDKPPEGAPAPPCDEKTLLPTAAECPVPASVTTMAALVPPPLSLCLVTVRVSGLPRTLLLSSATSCRPGRSCLERTLKSCREFGLLAGLLNLSRIFCPRVPPLQMIRCLSEAGRRISSRSQACDFDVG